MNIASYKKSIYVCMYAYIFLSKEKDVEKYPKCWLMLGTPRNTVEKGETWEGRNILTFSLFTPGLFSDCKQSISFVIFFF